jgi:hypothetical protein
VGSHVNLTCIVQFSPEPPEYVFWHHHDQVRTKKKMLSPFNHRHIFIWFWKIFFWRAFFKCREFVSKFVMSTYFWWGANNSNTTRCFA